LGHVELGDNVADALFALQQHGQDALAGVISQGFAELYAVNGHYPPQYR
jgi:hypothetical protein